MKRRVFLRSGLALTLLPRTMAGCDVSQLEGAGKILADAAESGDVQSSALYVQQGSDVFSRSWGLAHGTDAMFLLASISKTNSVASVLTVFDEGHVRLDENVQRYLPEFQGEGREKITIRQLMTHVSGLPDQLPSQGAGDPSTKSWDWSSLYSRRLGIQDPRGRFAGPIRRRIRSP